ncbi:hypothetical protein [Caballeronia hypogeia]|uniref:hypothetical protein n=1 Tax=Caballeronia hypogeia TaxID=1777140 RepID=UPI001E2C00C0|nr:hypothetical protein [Caballeronia hypogeia]
MVGGSNPLAPTSIEKLSGFWPESFFLARAGNVIIGEKRTMAYSKLSNPRAFPGNSNYGMSLRDYFAGQALAGDMADEALPSDASPALLEQRARLYYRLADAMLKVRAEDEALSNTTAMMGMAV